MLPARDRIAPRLDVELPHPGRRDCDVGAISIAALSQFPHHRELLAAAVRGAKYHAGSEHLVSLAKHSGADLERLTSDCADGTPAAVDDGLHIKNGNPADHP